MVTVARREIHAFGIEGTCSYGAGVARFLTGRGYTVIEVNRPAVGPPSQGKERSHRRRDGSPLCAFWCSRRNSPSRARAKSR